MTEHERGDRAQTGVAGVTPAEYEYNTLMRLLGVSVSKHLLENGLPPEELRMTPVIRLLVTGENSLK